MASYLLCHLFLQIAAKMVAEMLINAIGKTAQKHNAI